MQIHHYECKYGDTPNRIILGIDAFMLIKRSWSENIQYGMVFEEHISEDKLVYTAFGIRIIINHDNPLEISVGYVEEINI
jgi:hypothetical protein